MAVGFLAAAATVQGLEPVVEPMPEPAVEPVPVLAVELEPGPVVGPAGPAHLAVIVLRPLVDHSLVELASTAGGVPSSAGCLAAAAAAGALFGGILLVSMCQCNSVGGRASLLPWCFSCFRRVWLLELEGAAPHRFGGASVGL